MRVDSKEYRVNMAAARRGENMDRTISVIVDATPGFDFAAAREIIGALMDFGYLVQEIDAETFCKMTITELGFLVVIPHAEALPAICAGPLDDYWREGGRVLVLGGPLFAHLIEKQGDEYRDIPLDANTLDAAISGKMHPIIMEGFVPSYKVYAVEGVRKFMTEPDQAFVDRTLENAESENVICASARPHGLGYNMGRKNRFIPLIEAMGEGGRAEGRRGAAVYMMLSDVKMKRPGVDDNRFGYVIGTTRGACAAGIGLKRQDILRIDGMREVLEQLVQTLFRGIYFFEAGSECYTQEIRKPTVIGAKVMNQWPDYRNATVRFSVQCGNETVFSHSAEEMLLPGEMTDFAAEFVPEEYGIYTVSAELYLDGRKVDTLTHEVQVPESKEADPGDFVTVHDGEFWLQGKKWYPFGINYWPHYYPGLERDDYWLGWLDKTNYDPLEVERDMEMMEQMGFNCLFTRVDGNVMGRSIDTLRDFLLRCEKHSMKLSLSYCNVTSPLYFQEEPFRRFMERAGLFDNPVLFSHDLAWEVGMKFYQTRFMNSWISEWREWIIERYGSLENAEADWGVPVDRDEEGSIITPPEEEFLKDGIWRVKICAYRRFIDDFASRKWNDTVSVIREMDPRHLIAYRMGPIGGNSAALTATCKHIDYSSPEGYSVSNDDNGMYNAAAITLGLEMTTRNKPVVWSEYGVSLTDVRWRQLVWDNVNSRPYHWKEEQQTEYLNRLYRVFRLTNVRGSAPWWFPGGFRRVEMSDFGYCGPDGVLRPGAQQYVELGEWFKQPREPRIPDEEFTMDPDISATGWRHYLRGEAQENDENTPKDGNGNHLFGEVRGEASKAVQRAVEAGKTIAFRTPGTGTDSVSMPKLAVGNRELNGHNPPKYLDAEFNFVLMNGGKVKGKEANLDAGAPIQVSIGNIQEAAWRKLVPGTAGNCCLIVTGPDGFEKKVPIKSDTMYLEDALTEEFSLPTGEYRMRMLCEQVSEFGEQWKLVVRSVQ